MKSTTHRVYFQCALGLESLLQRELASLGVESRELEGGVEARTTFEDLQRVCLCSRLVESVRVRLKAFEARGFDDLQRRLRALPFRAFREPGTLAHVDVVSKKSKLWHSGAVAERVSQVLSQHVGWKIVEKQNVTARTQIVYVRVEEDRVQISLDAGGARMHRRGYRTNVEQASLRETLAAALVLASFEDEGEKAVGLVWDPFCGAGTVALEALSWARGIVPGAQRTHALQAWRSFDADAFARLKAHETQRASAEAPLPHLRVLLSDHSPEAVEAARKNAENLGVSAWCAFEVGDIDKVASRVWSHPGATEGAAEKSTSSIAVLTNPPYGRRIHEAGATRKLLALTQAHPELHPVTALVGGAARDVIPKDRRALFRTKNGGVPVSARRIA